MKPFVFEDFKKGDAWLIARLDTEAGGERADIYFLIELPSGLAIGHEFVTGETFSQVSAPGLLAQGREYLDGSLPKRVIIPTGDPAIPSIEVSCKRLGINVEPIPGPYLENLVRPLKEDFGKHFYSPSTFGYSTHSGAGELARESAKHFVPDSYDPCPCGSDERFKFCCKPGFKDMVLAQAEAQEGHKQEARKHIQKAKQLLGETAEVLCREAIVESYFDQSKSNELLEKALSVNSHHPRSNYLRGLNLKIAGRLEEATAYYRRAIENYPKTDRFHLNETYNNLGSTLYEMRKYALAKQAWEQALIYLPSDPMVRANLTEFIYENSELSTDLRQMSPFVSRFFKRQGK